MMRIIEYCLKCNKELPSFMHNCLGFKVVVDPVAYREMQRTSNPLDRLTVAETVNIYGGDAEAERRRFEELMEAHDTAYFQSPLIYRIEFESLSGELGFQSVIDGSAILTEGHTDQDWSMALHFLNETRADLSMLLSESEAYLCRLVSLDNEGQKYLWGVKRLECAEQTGWVFFDWV